MFARFVRFSVVAVCATAWMAPLWAQTNSLSATLQLASLPTTITLCRDPTAIQTFGVDEQWFAGIDVDANSATPGGTSNGQEVILLAETLPQSSGCSPTLASTQSSVITALLVWDSTLQYYVPSDIPVGISFDFVAQTITLTAPLTGPLANLKGAANLSAFAGGTYTPTGSSPTAAYDNSDPFTTGSGITDPTGDVLQCSSPCSPLASWYGLIDLTGASAATASPIAMYGADTVYFEFDTAGLPAMMSLCRYPQPNTFVDSGWLALLDIDNNPATGSGGIDTIVEAYTIPQNSGCTPNSVPLSQALLADINHWDSSQQTFVLDATVPVSADASTGKLTIQVDAHATALAGLSLQTLMGEQSYGEYPSGTSQPFAYDGVGPLPYGTAVSAPSGDVQNCSSPCSPTVDWYSQIDLVGGYVHPADHLFTGDFE